MELDDGAGDEESRVPLLPPDDRLWRHPSELAAHGPPPADGPARRRHGWGLAASAVAGGLAAVLGATLVAGTGPARHVEPLVPLSTVSVASAPGDGGAGDVARAVRPALVALEVEGGPGPGRGSGVVFRGDGHVLTAAQVVVGATRITAVTAGGRREPAELVGIDSGTDLAVVRLARASVRPAPLGDDRPVAVGHAVAATGSAPGPGGAWAAAGTVRAVGRLVARHGGEDLLDMIEVDMAVPPAAVGGALVDRRGAVVGITTSTPGSAPPGLATPIAFARHVADRLVATGRMGRAWLGIEGRDLDAAEAAALGVSGGVVVGQVRDGSPAEGAGLRSGTVVTAVAGRPVASMAALRAVLRWQDPGDSLVVAVIDPVAAGGRGRSRALRVDLAERPPAP